MAEDGEDCTGLEMTNLKSLTIFSEYTNNDVALLIYIEKKKKNSVLCAKELKDGT